MTADPATPADVTPLEAPAFALTSTTATKVRDTPFTLDGYLLIARRPKTSWFIDKQTEAGSMPEDDPRQVDLMHEVLDKLFPRDEDRAWFYGRLRDEDDDFDYEDLEAVFSALQERWAGGRPTGPSAGSAGRRRSGGGRSTARRR